MNINLRMGEQARGVDRDALERWGGATGRLNNVSFKSASGPTKPAALKKKKDQRQARKRQRRR